jgi:putative oxidoreductase
MKYILLLGRILFSALFIMKGVCHFSQRAIDFATHMGVPSPTVVVPIIGIFLLLGGLSILLGYKARVGAWIIVIFLVPATFMMHRFWMVKDPHQAMLHDYCFWKNISLVGAALIVAYFGSGPLSLSKGCSSCKR